MKEYIEREAVLGLQHRLYHSPLSTVIELSPTYIISPDAVQRIPAANVVSRDCYDRLLAENDELRKERPVVRCGECKHSAVDYENRRYCKLVTYYNHVPDDWFCADGERKDGDRE